MFTTIYTRRLFPLAALTTLLSLGATACGSSGDGGAAEGTRVLASFYPMAWVAEQTGGDAITVTNLTKPGAEPHDLELTPRQITDIGRAKLVLYIKGIQPAVDAAVQEHAKDRSIDAMGLVKALPAAEEDEAAHAAEAKAGSAEEEHGHTELPYDPHIWLDPSRLATVATAVGERLAKADATNAAAYRRNAGDLAARLTALDGEFRTGLATCRQRKIVTSHDAFGYLVNRYNLSQVSISGLSPESEPSPKRLAELSQEVKTSGVTTVFTETLASPKVADALAKEAGVRTAVLDPVEGVAEGSKDDYFSVMRRNLQALRAALTCT